MASNTAQPSAISHIESARIDQAVARWPLALHVVRKFKPGRMGPLEPIEPTLVDDLLGWYAQRGDGSARHALMDFLHRHHDSHWLVCGCRDDGPAQARPLLVIARSRLPVPSGEGARAMYCLRRRTDRAAHSPNCPFAFDLDRSPGARPRLVDDPDLIYRHPQVMPEALGDQFLKGDPTERRVATSGPGPTRHSAQAERGPAPPAPGLYSLLMALLAKARCNTMQLRPSTDSDWQACRSAAAGIVRTWRDGEISLAEVLQMAPAELPVDLPGDLFRQPAPHWPTKEERVAYALLVADRIIQQAESTETVIRFGGRSAGGGCVVLSSARIRINARPGDLAARRPYLVLLKARMDPVRGAQWCEAYAHPIAGKRVWLPVDSALERAAARCLWETLKLARTIYPDAVIEMDKPVFDIEGPAGSFRPDFRVTITIPDGERSFIFVEIMGDDSQDYLDAKRVTHERMKLEGQLVVNTRHGCDAGSADGALTRQLLKALKHTGAKGSRGTDVDRAAPAQLLS